MSQLIKHGQELLRIEGSKIMYSTNDGHFWHTRSTINSSHGAPQDITDTGKELLLVTEKGLLYSTNNGHAWHIRSNRPSF